MTTLIIKKENVILSIIIVVPFSMVGHYYGSYNPNYHSHQRWKETNCNIVRFCILYDLNNQGEASNLLLRDRFSL